jgi:hypothetical protein
LIQFDLKLQVVILDVYSLIINTHIALKCLDKIGSNFSDTPGSTYNVSLEEKSCAYFPPQAKGFAFFYF